MIEFILGAFIYARIKKGYKISYVLKNWTSWLPLGFAAFYIFLEITMWLQWYYFLPYSQIIKTATLLSYVPMIIKYRLYENSEGTLFPSPMIWAGICLSLGSSLNKIAVKVNGGMPTFPDISFWTGYTKPYFVTDGLHILGNGYNHLIILCNVFDLGWSVISIGDILCRLYVYIILFYAIKASNKILK